MQQSARTAAAYKSSVKPVWCPGCGHFAVLQSITRAFAELKLPPHEIAFISGIGCSSRIPAYTSVYGFHGVHGRALPLATGVKLARPELAVVVAGGDGDGFSIGGNHFLHACRRNVDLTYIVMDNQVYGMTKGQASPTTASDWSGSKLTPDGTGITPFQPLSIALAAGANYIARTISRDTARTTAIIMDAMRHPGFSVVQVLSPCITYHPEQQKQSKDRVHAGFEAASDPRAAARALIKDDGYTVGVLYRGTRPAYSPARDADIDPSLLAERFALVD